MRSYSERRIFTARELDCYRRAVQLVDRIDETVFEGELRCHEVARAVGKILELPHEDGRYIYADHTWLRVTCTVSNAILDVYAVGAMPPVQLLDAFPPLRRNGLYLRKEERTDIRQDIIDTLLQQMTRQTEAEAVFAALDVGFDAFD